MTLYLLGVITFPVIFFGTYAYAVAIGRGKVIECRVCGYSTGPIHRTRRITCWARWQWHKRTTGHHTRRWVRQQKAARAALGEIVGAASKRAPYSGPVR